MNYTSSTNTTDKAFLKVSHNCPTCRCYPNPSQTSPNLYLSSFGSSIQKLNNMLITFNPRKNMFIQTSPDRLDNSSSTAKVGITFSYSSPIYLRKNQSLENCFSTKKFKQKKFPHLKLIDQDTEPVLQILKNKKNRNFVIQNIGKTPQKARILKMNRIKVIKQGRSTSSLNIFSNSSSKINLPQGLNQQESKFQYQTPIEGLKENISPKISPVVVERDYLPKIKRIQGDIQKGQLQIQSQNKSLTPKSIQNNQKMVKQQKKSDESETSLKIGEEMGSKREERLKKGGLIEASDRELAQNLSFDLALNYDYYFLVQESDRSLSLNVSL